LLSDTRPAISEASVSAEQLSNIPSPPSRRTLLQRALSAAAIASWAMRTAAQQKMSHTDAEYQDRPNSGLICAACTLFRPPRSCEIVEGDISPRGWCKFFDLPD
jgi:hypothetical protein